MKDILEHQIDLLRQEFDQLLLAARRYHADQATVWKTLRIHLEQASRQLATANNTTGDPASAVLAELAEQLVIAQQREGQIDHRIHEIMKSADEFKASANSLKRQLGSARDVHDVLEDFRQLHHDIARELGEPSPTTPGSRWQRSRRSRSTN